jgi:transcriptional regulator with XRE-family HTH domain
VLPALRQRRSPEHAARIATKRRLFEFIQMLETRRAELGISRSAIARELGVTQPTISRLFSGHVQNIELRTMVRVAEVLDSDLELVIRPRTLVEIFGESELTERDAHLEDGEELMRKTSPAYDDFWRSRLEENDDIEGALRAVADGAGDQAIDVPGLTKKGKRPAGWGGSMCVWAISPWNKVVGGLTSVEGVRI